MEKSVINPQETETYKKNFRFLLIATGATLYIFSGYFTVDYSEYLLKIFGIFLFIPGAMNPFSIFGGNNKMVITDEFIKVTDEMTLTRTAYWNKINEAVLTRFSLRVYYESGAGENFKIPYLKQEKFEEIRSKILKKSKEQNFSVEEKQWWKIF